MPPIQRDIVLEPLVGRTEPSEEFPDGIEVTHAMTQIFLNKVRVGYASEHLGKTVVSIIRPGVETDKETMAEIQKLVEAKFAQPVSKIDVAPVLTDEAMLNAAAQAAGAKTPDPAGESLNISDDAGAEDAIKI